MANGLHLEQPARILRKLTENDDDLFTNPDHSFKVWPTNQDRESIRAVMRGKASESPEGLRLVEASLFFREQMLDWLTNLGAEAGAMLDAFVKAVRDHIRLVVIDLDGEDNAQVIFETLNAAPRRCCRSTC